MYFSKKSDVNILHPKAIFVDMSCILYVLELMKLQSNLKM